MLDLSGVPREYLFCRAFAHPWDHGKAPIQVDETQRPVLWVTRARCSSCGTRRWRWFTPVSCEKLGQWEYSHPSDWKRHMHLVTQMEAQAELARRDQVGDDVGKRRAKKAG